MQCNKHKSQVYMCPVSRFITCIYYDFSNLAIVAPAHKVKHKRIGTSSSETEECCY